MAVRSDIEIARDAKKRPIQEIGAKLSIENQHLLPYGHDKAKISAEFIASLDGRKDGKLILVTAINPTITASVRRRSNRSTKAPRNAPNSPIGRSRSMVIIATAKAEPVCR